MKKYIYALMTDRRQGFMDRIVKYVLWLMSKVYGFCVYMLRWLYAKNILPSYRAPKSVISIGNITLGGVGKTPLVIAVVQALAARGIRTAILTRGYMPKGQADLSDEARMLKEHLPQVPVMIGADRKRSIDACLKRHAVDVFICDDAFQHWPLKRDLDIVAIDAVNPFGNGHVLPRGILREGIDALKYAQIIVLTKTNQPQAKPEALHERIMKMNPQAIVAESHHVCVGCVEVFSRKPYDHYHLKGVSVVAFCAIADSGSFRQTLAQAGFNVANVFVFMDHHVYVPEDMAMVRKWAMEHHVQVILMTHKDAVKIQQFKDFFEGFRMYYVQIELEITYGKNVFIERVISAVRR